MQPKKQQHRLSERLPGALIVLAGHEALQQTADLAGAFRQDAAFLWLTGIDEPGWKAIYETTTNRLTLVKPKKSAVQIIFDGESNDSDIKLLSGAAEVIESKDFEAMLRSKARTHSVAYTVYDQTDYGFVSNPAQKTLHEQLQRIFSSVQSCEREVHALKAIKLPEELKSMQTAIDITVDAFNSARSQLDSVKTEYELEAIFSYEFRSRNAAHAYEPIVASGKNACTLHYVKNSDKLQKAAPVLIDIGARFEGYCADITRTYMLKPTKYQQEVHAALQKAQLDIINLLEPNLSVEEYIKSSDLIMKQTLIDLKLMKTLDDDETYRHYLPHAMSHGLGIDVHDSLGRPRYFEEGMVLTVEPGIYIPEKSIGMRIEDNIIITKTGRKNLSAKLSTEP